MNRLIFILGVIVVIVGALPLFPELMPKLIPTSGQNYQYLIMGLGGLVALIGFIIPQTESIRESIKSRI